MKKTVRVLMLLVAGATVPAAAETDIVRLADYAFDFPTYGYEITVSGETQNYVDKLTADDYVTINDDGYMLKTLIDRMGRQDRRGFIQFFNDHCIGFTPADACPITASGDIELDENMKMIFRMSTAIIRKGGQEWSNAAE